MQIKIIRNPYCECEIAESLVLEAEINIHGAYGVKRENLYDQGVAHVFELSKIVFFPSRCVEEL